MKKHLALILAILMTLPLFTAAAAEGLDQDAYPDIYLSDSELAKIVGPFYDRIYTAVRFKEGALAIMSGDEIGYFENGSMIMKWNHATSEFDCFFDVFAYPLAEYSICAILIGGDIVSFRDDLSMGLEVHDVYEFALGDDAVYAYRLSEDGMLYYWSPYVYIPISSGVEQAITFYGMTFLVNENCISIVGADAFDIGKLPMDYYRHHDIHVVPLGDGTIDDYATEALGENFEPDESRIAAFCEKYGFTFSTGSNEIKHDFSVSDFAEYPYTTVNYCLAAFDPPADEYADPLLFRDISFNGNTGDLLIYLANEVEIRQIRWVSADNGQNLVEELNNLVASESVYVSGGSSGKESIYRYGDQLIHIGCQEDGRVYIYANNMRKVSE